MPTDLRSASHARRAFGDPSRSISRARRSPARPDLPGLLPTSSGSGPASARPARARRGHPCASTARNGHLQPSSGLGPASSRARPDLPSAFAQAPPGLAPASARGGPARSRAPPGLVPASARPGPNIRRTSRGHHDHHAPRRARWTSIRRGGQRASRSRALGVAYGARPGQRHARGGRRARRPDAVRVDPPGRNPRAGDRRRAGGRSGSCWTPGPPTPR